MSRASFYLLVAPLWMGRHLWLGRLKPENNREAIEIHPIPLLELDDQSRRRV